MEETDIQSIFMTYLRKVEGYANPSLSTKLWMFGLLY